MKFEPIKTFALFVLIGTSTHANAQPLAQLNCTDSESKSTFTILQDGEPGASAGTVKLTTGDKHLLFTGTYQHVDSGPSRVIRSNIEISARAARSGSSLAETVTATLSSFNTFNSYSGLLEFKTAMGRLISHYKVVCDSKDLVTLPVNPRPLPFPPPHCGRCAF